MPKGRRLGAEQIVTKLRQIEVLQAKAKTSQWLARKSERLNKRFTAGARSTAVSTSIRPSG